jgi:tetratricopeptide (TPR) repeat protein
VNQSRVSREKHGPTLIFLQSSETRMSRLFYLNLGLCRQKARLFFAPRDGLRALVYLLAMVGLAAAQDHEPRVARVQMQLKFGDDIVDIIEPGELLTVVGEQEQAFVILTHPGRRGLVEKVNAVKLAEAVEIYDELIKQSPMEGRLYTQRATAWWARGERQRALADFDRAIQLGYAEPHAFTSRGMFHTAVGNVEEAIKDFGQAIQKNPRDEVPYINRAAVYLAQNKLELALKDYTQAIELNPKKAGNYQQRAVAHKMKGDLGAAQADFDKALELDPKYLPALMGRGYLWYEQEKHQQAIADFSAVIALDPNSAAAYNNRGFNQQLLGDGKRALADYNRALELAPDYALCHQNKAWLLATSPDDALRNGPQAVKAALVACELDKYQNPADMKALAAAYAEAGQFELAIGWQEKALKLSSADDKAVEEKVLEQYKDKRPYRDVAVDKP